MLYSDLKKLGEKPSLRLLVSLKLHSLDDYSEDLAIFTTKPCHDGKYGFIDNPGNVVIDAKWDGAMPFSEVLATVMVGDYENSKWGLIDKTNKVLCTTTKYEGLAGTAISVKC